jgi:hypothetical protein
MIGYYIMFGGIVGFAWTIVLLDWLGRRQEKRRRSR